MKNIEEMKKAEKSLLMYLETRAVDHAGSIDSRKMNSEDFELAEKWNEEKFIEFGRICTEDIERKKNFHPTENNKHWCHLSEEAFTIVHQLRKVRADSSWKNRTYMTTAEKKEE